RQSVDSPPRFSSSSLTPKHRVTKVECSPMSHAPADGRQHGRSDAATRKAEDNPQELLRAGIFLLRRDEPREAVRILERAHHLDPKNPMTCSYLGLAMALARSGTKQAVQLCEDAVRGGTFHAELYHN